MVRTIHILSHKLEKVNLYKMKHLILFFFLNITICLSQNNTEISYETKKEELYKYILRSKKNFALTVYSNGIGKYDYLSELEAEFCGKEEDQEGTAIYFKLLEETDKIHSIPINYKKFKNSKYYNLLKNDPGKKFKIRGRIKTSPIGNVYLRVDKIKPI